MDNGNLNQYDNGSGNRNGNQGGGNNQGGSNNQSPRRQSLLLLLIAALVTLLCMSYFMKTMNGLTNKEIPYNQFVDMIEKGQVESVEISEDQITITPKQDGRGNTLYETPSITYHTGKVEDDDTLTARLLKHDVEIKGDIPDNSSFLLSILLTYV